MAAGQTLGQFQSQRQMQVISPQMRRSLELLQKPLPELRQHLRSALESNPALEEVPAATREPPRDLAADELFADPGQAPAQAGEAELDFDPAVDRLRDDDDFRDYLLQGLENADDLEDRQERRRRMFDSVTRDESLAEHLLKQVETSDLNASDREVARLMLGDIDANGYFIGSLPDYQMFTGRSAAELLRILAVIRTFDPPGVAARDARECLLLQIDSIPEAATRQLARQIVDTQLPTLAERGVSAVVAALGADPDDVADALAAIRRLNPYPGRAFSQDHAGESEPEVAFVRGTDGRPVARVLDPHLPLLRVNADYRTMLKTAGLSDDDQRCIRDYIREGEALIESVGQRQETIRRIAQAIADGQPAFWTQGRAGLRPMTMAEIAKTVGVHETTVSRTAREKYAKTPFGVMALRDFFTSGVRSASGELVSNESVKQSLAEMIAAEDKAHPLSDDALSARLAAAGIDCARRTVAKYRMALKIPSARERKDGRL